MSSQNNIVCWSDKAAKANIRQMFNENSRVIVTRIEMQLKQRKERVSNGREENLNNLIEI